MKVLFSSLLVILLVNNSLSSCIWNVNKDLPEKDALFIKKVGRKYKLYYPNSTNIELQNNEGLIASCPGTKNYVSGFTDNTSFVKLSCVAGTTVVVDKQVQKDIKHVSCTKNAVADVVNTNNVDTIPASRILSVGFETEFGWLELYKVSYDFNSITPLYSQHVIHGSSLKGAYTGNASRPGFKTNAVPSSVSWTKIFTKNHQRQVFAGILGGAKTDAYLSSTYLSRGHLAPDADFHYRSWEIASYFYANVVPQWQSINQGNWLRVENAVRHKAMELQADIFIITGAQGVSTLEGNQLYLDGESVPVPKYIFKIICTKSAECISFIVINNPFESDSLEVCRNVCSRQRDSSGWYLSSYDDVQKGRVICCDVTELQKAPGFKDILPAIGVNGILIY